MDVDLALSVGACYLRGGDLSGFMHVEGSGLLSTSTPAIYIRRPRFECELLLSFVLGCDRSSLHAGSVSMTHGDIERYFVALSDRRSAVPLEYITGRAGFYGNDFFVNENVLIPRSDSELLVQHAISLITEHGVPSVVEVGVGSGAIILSVLSHVDGVHAMASDISVEALNVASINAQQLGLNLSLTRSDLLRDLDIREHTLLICNPPYIAHDYPLDEEVRNEPSIALYGGDKGDEILKELISQAGKHNNVDFLICEIGYDQMRSAEIELCKCGFRAEFHRDINGFYRCFVAEKSPDLT